MVLAFQAQVGESGPSTPGGGVSVALIGINDLAQFFLFGAVSFRGLQESDDAMHAPRGEAARIARRPVVSQAETDGSAW